MITNLPPELRDLEIHVQDILTKLLEIQETLVEVDNRLKALGG